MLQNKKGNSHRGGSIILTASVAALRSGAGSVDYSASKAAVASLAYTGANSYPGANIRVNAICPGLIQTQMTGPIFAKSRDRSKIGQLCSLRRYGIADEVASVVLFLASEDASCTWISFVSRRLFWYVNEYIGSVLINEWCVVIVGSIRRQWSCRSCGWGVVQLSSSGKFSYYYFSFKPGERWKRWSNPDFRMQCRFLGNLTDHISRDSFLSSVFKLFM